MTPVRSAPVADNMANQAPSLNSLAKPKEFPRPLEAGWLGGGLAWLQPSGQIIEVNRPLADWLQQTESALVGQSLETLLTTRGACWKEPWSVLWASNSNFARLEWRMPPNENEPAQWFELELIRHPPLQLFRLSSILPPLSEADEAGHPPSLNSLPTQKEMYYQLAKTGSQLDLLMRHLPGVAFSQRPDCSFYFVSPKIEEWTGVPLLEWQRDTRRFWEVIHDADAQQVRQHLQQTSKTAEPLASTFRIRHIKTAKVTYVLEHRRAICASNGLLLGYQGLWLDTTRQTLAEKRLTSAGWKETLAAVTMGMAHDLRNVMAGILGLTDTFQAQLDKSHPFYEGLSLIRGNAWQATHSIQRILDLHHGKSGEKNYQDLNQLVQEMVEVAQKVVPRRIAQRSKLAPGQLPLYIDAFEFRQTFLNLVLNACDAMPSGGQLLLETSRHTTMPNGKLLQGSVPRLPAVCFAVSDTGSGIPEKYLGSIFDPFFTTKGVHKGSGLGLYNVRLFVEQHQGAISVESQENRGTTFRLWLPEADFSEAERQSRAPERHTLLVLGAPGPALDSTGQFLRQAGFSVVVATDHATALEYLQAPFYHFAAALMQTSAQSVTFLADIKKARLSVKTILHVIGCNQDELDTALLESADLIIPADSPGNEMVAKIRDALPAAPNSP
jgi:signal transduction histidine kinase